MTHQSEISDLRKQIETLQQSKEQLEDKYFNLFSTHMDTKIQEIKGITKLVTTVSNNNNNNSSNNLSNACSKFFSILCKVISLIYWTCFLLLISVIVIVLGNSSYDFLIKEYSLFKVRPDYTYNCVYSKIIIPSHTIYNSECNFNYIKCVSLTDYKYINIKDNYVFQNKSELYKYAVDNTQILNCNKITQVYNLNYTKVLKVNLVTNYNMQDDTFYINNTFTCMPIDSKEIKFIMSTIMDYRIQREVYNTNLYFLKEKCKE